MSTAAPATTSHYPGVIIDGAVGRTDLQRCARLLDYLSDLSPTVAQEVSISPNDDYTEVENEIIDRINQVLPDQYVCTVGEFCPGDVIVREIGPDDYEVI